MKHQHHIKRTEFITHDSQIQPDNDRMHNDSEFKDQEGSDLLFEGVIAGVLVDGIKVFDEPFFVVVDYVADVQGAGLGVAVDGVRVVGGAAAAGDGALDVLFVVVAVFDFDVAFGSELLSPH